MDRNHTLDRQVQVEKSRHADLLLHDQYRMRETWNNTFPEDELERIANVFGFSFD